MVSVKGSRRIGSAALVEGVGYYRYSRVTTFNGDTADDEGEGTFDAFNNRSRTRAHSSGGTVQVTSAAPLLQRGNHFIAGAGVDTAAAHFNFASEWAHLTPTRGTIGSGLFDDDAAVDLKNRATTASAFVTNIWSPAPKLSVTGSARFNFTDVALRDQLGTALTGDHTFGRLNPAAGVTFQLRPDVNLYGSYTESSRVPTPVEPTCADPEDPCRLPNAFVSDPPLDQIVARTWEAGARGGAGRLNWSLSAYATAANDDIIFVSSGALRGEGHFENVDRTLRRGLEASVTYDLANRLSVFANYTLQRATFGTDLVIASRFHPLAVDHEISVESGSWLPGVPAQSAKLGAAGALTSRLHAGFALRSQSDVFLRGEGNLLDRIPGLAVGDAYARYRVTKRLTIAGDVSNLFGTEYYTFGVLGDPSILGEGFESERFYSPAQPRAWRVGCGSNPLSAVRSSAGSRDRRNRGTGEWVLPRRRDFTSLARRRLSATVGRGCGWRTCEQRTGRRCSRVEAAPLPPFLPASGRGANRRIACPTCHRASRTWPVPSAGECSAEPQSCSRRAWQ
jgi:iron complex outermembrane recepter protein